MLTTGYTTHRLILSPPAGPDRTPRPDPPSPSLDLLAEPIQPSGDVLTYRMELLETPEASLSSSLVFRPFLACANCSLKRGNGETLRHGRGEREGGIAL